MNNQITAIKAEFLKNKHTRIRWITFASFAMAPVFGGIFMLMMKGRGYEGLSGVFKFKAEMMSFEANWASLLSLLSQAVGIGGVVIFGFIASWLFGREYTEGTAKDLLALPVSRSCILNAKFIYYLVWSLALVFSNLIIGLLIGAAVGLEGWSNAVFLESLKTYFITTILIVLLNTPVAFFALWGRGYLAPLGFVILLLVSAQIMGVMGIGTYFPWSIPGIYSGSGGVYMKMQLNTLSFAILILTGLIGYIGTLLWWKYSDQK